MARVACRGLPRIDREGSGSERHGLAGTEWRMQIDGERLGRAGFVVAGNE